MAQVQTTNVYNLRSPYHATKRAKNINISSTRLANIVPKIWDEIQHYFNEDEVFTRDHLLYCACLRQFSMAYRIALVRHAVNELLDEHTLIRYNMTDLGLYTPKNIQRRKTMLRNNEAAYSGSYTTRAADELLSRPTDPDAAFDAKWLAEWLQCLQNLAESTRYIYASRIVKDLTRRGVLKDMGGRLYSVIRL